MSGDHVEVPLSQGLVALVDRADLTKIAAHGWHAARSRRTFYARTNIMRDGKRTSVSMHRFLTGFAETDHVNGNGLDNRRGNLRAASDAENARNRQAHQGSTSRYKGVSRLVDRRVRKGTGEAPLTVRWAATIHTEGRSRRIGTFSTEAAAAQAYDEAARRAFGSYARLNFEESE
jgi:hypothetical protein